MKTKTVETLPTKIFLYRGSGDTSVLVATTRLSDIPEDREGEAVGEYHIIDTKTLTIVRGLV